MPHVKIFSKKCKGCGLCVKVCPKKVLELSSGHLNDKGYTPCCVVSPEDCIGCGFCALMCPDCVIEIEMDNKKETKK
ncbi:MAG: tungsten formylmethanofuran dehydrogenase [Oscillospiraceae bacterium]|jgi:2-oxoglutarate ferredoxin oxidoreductase subunit delta|nr:tungsten formylmethanofuran dehydrogenase [Oscillospiraceae bacterium]